MMDSLEFFSVFLGIRNHFTSTYDYSKYGPMKRVNELNPQFRRNFVLINSLSPKFNKIQLERRLKANFKKKDIWISDINSKEACTNDASYVKIHRNLPYYFEQDLIKLQSIDGIIQSLLIPAGLSSPAILGLVNNGFIEIETFIILDKLIGFTKKFNPILLASINRITKYSLLVNVDLKVYASIARNYF